MQLHGRGYGHIVRNLIGNTWLCSKKQKISLYPTFGHALPEECNLKDR